MSKKDWASLGAATAIGTAIVTWHGLTSKRWESAHTMLVLAGLAVTLASHNQ